MSGMGPTEAQLSPGYNDDFSDSLEGPGCLHVCVREREGKAVGQEMLDKYEEGRKEGESEGRARTKNASSPVSHN